jgi:hypothetical protein
MSHTAALHKRKMLKCGDITVQKGSFVPRISFRHHLCNKIQYTIRRQSTVAMTRRFQMLIVVTARLACLPSMHAKIHSSIA